MGGYKDIANLLITNGADVNVRADNSWTPLMNVARDGHKDLAELLIVNGADVNAKDKKGKTPLSLVESRGHIEIVGLLKKHWAKK